MSKENPDSLPLTKNGSREIRFLENLSLGLSVLQAGINAGYSESYARSTLSRKLSNPNFVTKIQKYVEKFPETRTSLAKLRLPRLFNLEEQFYQKCEADPELYARYSKVSERDYKLAGLLKEEVRTQILVPVQVSVQVQGSLEAQQAGDTVTIENTDTKDTE